MHSAQCKLNENSTYTTFTWHRLMRTKQKETPNFIIVVMEVNKLSTHLGAHPTIIIITNA
jgi:hypothetical protein